MARPIRNVSVACVVWVAGEDCQGAVDLFSEHDAGKLMGQGQTAEGNKEVGALACSNRPPIGRTDSKHEALSPPIANASDLRGELLRGVLLAAAIEQNRIGQGTAWLARQPLEDFCLGIEELGIAGDVPGGAFDIVGEQTIRGLGLGASTAWSDGGKSDLHCTRVHREVSDY